MLRMGIADVEIGNHWRADSVDRADVRSREAPPVSAGSIEADAQDLDLRDGRVNRSIPEDSAH